MNFPDLVTGVKQEQRSIVVDSLKWFLSSKNDMPSFRMEGHHISQLYGLCPRKDILKRLSGFKFEGISAVTYAKFDIGTALHEWYQNMYLGPMDLLIGKWKCKYCGTVASNYKMPDGFCTSCMQKRVSINGVICSDCIWDTNAKRICQLCPRWGGWEYQEPFVNDPATGIVGHCDGIVKQWGKTYVLEMKTMDTYYFDRLTEPRDDHVFQVRLYMHILNVQLGLVLYIDKNARGENKTIREKRFPVKEFVVESDSGKSWDSAVKRVDEVEYAREHKILPGRYGKTPNCEFCRWCGLKDLCFNDFAIRELLGKNKDWSRR